MSPNTTSEDLPARAVAWVQAFRDGDLDRYLTFSHDDALVYGYADAPLQGESLRRFYQTFMDSFELASTVQEDIWAGNKHASRWTMRAKQIGEYLDIEPSGRWVEVPGMSMQTWQDGRIIERWSVTDMSTFNDQLRAR